MEAHEDFLVGVGVESELLALDALLVHVAGNGVVDVEQRNSILRDTCSDVLRQCTIDVNLTSYGDSTAGQTAVDIAGNETELSLEGRPALVSHSNELTRTLVSLNPVEQCQLILSELRQHLRNLVAVTELLGHVSSNLVDAWVVSVLLESFEQVEL